MATVAILAFETSCDETSAAVVKNGQVLSNVVSSQTALHAEYGGVVPELAAREHLRNLIPVARAALDQANIAPDAISGVAATQGPGLPSALLVGLKAAQSFAFAVRSPFIGIHHHEAHLFSPWIKPGSVTDFADFEPNVSLIVSGGHTILVHVRSETDYQVLGSTLDDAAGECFDKAGKLLGLPYPAGPEIDKLSEHGNPAAYDFPRPLLNEPNSDFSFSGLKTSIRYFIRDHPEILERRAALFDLCASVQQAIVDVLVGKTLAAARRTSVSTVTASGGVTCNRTLRSQLTEKCGQAGLKLSLADPSLCTDNAAMIGVLAERKLSRGTASSFTMLDDDIFPGWPLTTCSA